MSYFGHHTLRAAVFSMAVAAVLPTGLLAQDSQTLADIRQDLTVFSVEIKRLQRELSTTGSSQTGAISGSIPDKVGLLESELQRLTGKIEQLEFRINSIVKDGTNRLGDLEFRLVELEGGDLSQLGETSTLGGAAAGSAAAVPARPIASDQGPETQLAVGEQADFDSAQVALANGDYAAAADQFQMFYQNYPGSPMEPVARIARGTALEKSGDMREAARAYLDTYTAQPSGAVAGDALFLLGRALGKLGKNSEACVTLGEVSVRHPGSAAASQAEAERSSLGCS